MPPMLIHSMAAVPTAGTISGFRFFRDSTKQALLRMGSVAEAVAALVALHNMEVGGRRMRVGFSKHTMD